MFLGALAAPTSVLAITLIGTNHANILRGTRFADRLFGRGGADRLYGGPGNDVLVGGSGSDRLYGGPGNDTIQARDGVRDFVDCGPGRDTAVVDAIDVVRGCEVVRRPSPKTGSRTNPIPVGAPAAIGQGWTIKVLAAVPNATARILSWDRSNNPPGAGSQFFVVQVEATLSGRTPRYLSAAYRLQAVAGRHHYTTFQNSCGAIPDPDLETLNPQVFPPHKLRGSVCWDVRVSDASRLLMYTDDKRGGIKRVYFALR